MAVVLLKYLACSFFDWLRQATRDRLDRQRLSHLFQAHPPLEVSSVDPKNGYSVTLEAVEEECSSISITQRPSDQGRLHEGHYLEYACSLGSMPLSSIAPSPKGFEHKIREEKTFDNDGQRRRQDSSLNKLTV